VTEPAAGEIIVHRCLVRVVRHGGWSWGPDPQGLMRQVLAALPDLLAARFDDLLTGDGPDVEITEPVRLSVLWGQSPSVRIDGVTTGFVIEPTVGALPVPEPVPEEELPPVTVSGSPPPTDDPGGRPLPDAVAATPAQLFGELAVREELAPLLALLPSGTLRMFAIAALTGPAGDPSEAGTVAGHLRAELARRFPAAPPATTREDLRRQAMSLPDDALPPADPVATAEPEPPVPQAATGPRSAGETRVSSALPFLLVGPLARTGYLDAVGPALAAADLPASLFAAALAYKVLGAPERGWRRSPDDDAAAAAFAGLTEVPDLGDFARRVGPALPVLDSVLALSLCRGHDPADPLLVTGVDDGLLLVDTQGTFPMAWAPDVAGLLPHWATCGRPPVVVCDSPLPAACLRDLAAAGVPILTDVRPLRGDPLTRLPWRTPLWTHDVVETRLAAEFPGHAARSAELVRSLFELRSAIPRAGGSPLERSVALAASLSLGMMAWTLWHERETPDPGLTLTRFADLEARVQFLPDVVRVRLPLGRRHTDLLRGGLLTDVHDVLWLNGRALTFSGG
jgi:hypothetical protein